MDDCTIIKKLKLNNEVALEKLIEQYTPYVAAVSCYISKQSLTVQDIEEISSDVFFSVWKNRMFIQEVESLKPYIAQITRNETRKKLLKKKTELSFEEEQLQIKQNDFTEQIITKQEVLFIHNLITEFKNPDKEILLYYYFNNYKLEEISSYLDLPLSTVKSKLYRGRNVIIKKYRQGEFV